MQRTTRLFEIIQILRATRGPLRAEDLAERLEVSTRTIYRDIATLQSMGTPVEGAAGIGYMMRRGYDLPPLNFDAEEVEALQVGLSMLARSGDSHLTRAAARIHEKIDALQAPLDWLQVAPFGAKSDDRCINCIKTSLFRAAIREERKLQITYRDDADIETTRVILPIALIYHVDCAIIAAWCELRGGFRHFRRDRLWACTETGARFEGRGAALRALWQEAERANAA